MSKVYCVFVLVLCLTAPLHAQKRRLDQDPTLNNLVHPEGYETCELGTLGRVTKVGSGPQEMILIAGSGFGGEIFDNFMKSKTDRYTMYAVTLPGFGGTAAPPMPDAGTSYGAQSWPKAAQKGVERLIAEKKMKKLIVVGHWWIGTQVALGLAIDHPDEMSAVVIISGIAKNAATDAQFGRTLTPEQRAKYIDTGMAPQWFKTVTRDTWYDNNWYPHHLAQHPVRALQLWRMSYQPTLPVWIRYTCEGWAQDVTTRLDKLKVPTLVLKPGFDDAFFSIPGTNDTILAYCHESWKGVEELSSMMTVQTIEDSRAFIMDDQPERLDRAIDTFLAEALD